MVERCPNWKIVQDDKKLEFKVKHMSWGQNTLNPLKIVVRSIIFLQKKLVTNGHYILDFFVCLKYIWLVLDLS